jgi:CSLREA domain-containing protein
MRRVWLPMFIVGLILVFIPPMMPQNATHAAQAVTPAVRLTVAPTLTPSLILSVTPTVPTLTPFVTPPDSGQILLVNSLVDTDDGACSVTACSLRDAIKYASWGTTINFAPGLTGTITLVKDLLVIRKNLIINGPGPKASDLVVDGNHRTIFTIRDKVTVSISTMTIANGDSIGGSGGIVN